MIDVQNELAFDVDFGGDMSANRRAGPYFIGDASKFSADFSWPGTSTGVVAPTGAFTIEATNNPRAASGTVLPITTAASFVADKPAGSAGSAFLNNVENSSSCLFFVYTATSGGTGATPVCRVCLK
jgi:hypothetical protein